MRTGNAVNLLPPSPLFERKRSQNRRQYHSWTMDPSQRLVQADRATGFRPRDLRCSDREIGGGEIQACCSRAQSGMQIARAWTGAVFADKAARNVCSSQGPGGNQTEALMDREHVRAPIELGLLLGAAPGFGGRETEVREGRFAGGARRRIRQLLLLLR